MDIVPIPCWSVGEVVLDAHVQNGQVQVLRAFALRAAMDVRCLLRSVRRLPHIGLCRPACCVMGCACQPAVMGVPAFAWQ